MVDTIIKALELSNGDPYLAKNRVAQLNEPYGDLLWVRGTNTSIFLSCYRADGGWKLMSKAAQFRKGFVPMMETIDQGITQPLGTNNINISGFPGKKIKGSGGYATKEYNLEPVDEAKLEEDLRMLFDSAYKCSAVKIAYVFFRIRQYKGLETPILDNFKNTACYKEAQKQMKLWNDFFTKAIRILSDDFDAYRAQAVELRGLEDRKGYLELEKTACKKYDFSRQPYFVPVDFYAQEIESNDANFLRDGFHAMDSVKFFERVFAIAMFANTNKIFRRLKKSYTNQAELGIARVGFQQLFLETAIDTSQPPAFLLTESDKAILESPIPIVVASRKQRPVEGISDELNMIDSIEIGPEGADVIYVRQREHSALRTLLQERSIDLEIRVDDSIF